MGPDTSSRVYPHPVDEGEGQAHVVWDHGRHSAENRPGVCFTDMKTIHELTFEPRSRFSVLISTDGEAARPSAGSIVLPLGPLFGHLRCLDRTPMAILRGQDVGSAPDALNRIGLATLTTLCALTLMRQQRCRSCGLGQWGFPGVVCRPNQGRTHPASARTKLSGAGRSTDAKLRWSRSRSARTLPSAAKSISATRAPRSLR